MPEACRITDPSHCPACSHGCPKCPHDVTGPATSGSVDVHINGIYALRKQDRGRHAACCGENAWEVTDGAPGVFINGRNAARVGDPVEHCGGNGQLSGGSGNVIIGDYKKGEGPPELPFCGGFELEDEHGELLPFTRYVIRTPDGKEHQGRSDHRGQTCLVFTDSEDDLEVEILPDDCTDYEEPEAEMAAAKKKKSTHGKHRTKPVKGARKGRRKKAARPPVVVDPAKPANAVYKTLDKDPVYGAEFKFDWTVGGCFNASCTQKHANITTAGWKEKYIVSVKVPGIPKLGAMRLHKRIAPQFEAFFKAAIVKGLADKVVNYEGGFTARTITNNQARLSNHALGTAIDINTVQNGYGMQPAARGAHGSLSEFADYCVDFGLYWGGWYDRNKDAMHFEAVKVMTAAELQAACTKHGVAYATLSQSPDAAAPANVPIPQPRPKGL